MLTKFLKGAAVGSLPVWTICVFAPLAIYTGNPEEFTASFVELLRVVAPYALVFCVACGASAIFLGRAGFSRFVAVTSALAILVWLQGNILVWDYGPLDGHSINWLLGVERGVLDAAIWVTLIPLAVLAHERFGRVMAQGATAAVAIQLVAAGVLLASNGEFALARSDIEENSRAKPSIMRFSGTSNVLHIVMDGFQTDIFKAIIEDPANSAYKELLQGFTLFENNVGAYSYTQMSVPALLTGKLYRNQVPAEEFIDASLRGRTILDAAIEAGFEIDIAAPVALKNTYAKSTHTNAYGIPSSDHVSPRQLIRSESARLMDLSLFRVVPHFAKAMVYRDDLWLFQAGANARSYQHIQYFADLALIRELTRELTVDRSAPVYKMMHLMLSHRPTVGNDECLFDGRRRTNRRNVTIQAGCALQAIVELLTRLKELGIYDDSLIVLMADHGAWVPVEGLVNETGETVIDAVGIAMATPVLAVKRPGAKHAFRTSRAPTSILDVPATIAAVLDLGATFGGVSAFALDSESVRPRRHFDYAFGRDKDAGGYLMDLQEFLVEGDPLDVSAWRRGRSYRPAGKMVRSEAVD